MCVVVYEIRVPCAITDPKIGRDCASGTAESRYVRTLPRPNRGDVFFEPCEDAKAFGIVPTPRYNFAFDIKVCDRLDWSTFSTGRFYDMVECCRRRMRSNPRHPKPKRMDFQKVRLFNMHHFHLGYLGKCCKLCNRETPRVLNILKWLKSTEYFHAPLRVGGRGDTPGSWDPTRTWCEDLRRRTADGTIECEKCNGGRGGPWRRSTLEIATSTSNMTLDGDNGNTEHSLGQLEDSKQSAGKDASGSESSSPDRSGSAPPPQSSAVTTCPSHGHGTVDSKRLEAGAPQQPFCRTHPN